MESLIFVTSKVFWGLANPGTLLVLLAVTALVCLWRNHIKLARVILTLVVAVMVALTVLPIGQWVVGPLEARFAEARLPDQIEGMIILGERLIRPSVGDGGKRQLMMRGSEFSRLLGWRDATRRLGSSTVVVVRRWSQIGRIGKRTMPRRFSPIWGSRLRGSSSSGTPAIATKMQFTARP